MELWMNRWIKNYGWWIALFVGVGLQLAPSSARADCIELKNDEFNEQQQTPVVAVRSFCISEQYGTIFTVPQDMVIQKVRLLISGDGQRAMGLTPLKVSIYKEKAPDSAEPGEQLVKEAEYSPPGTITQPTPQWLEITDFKVSLKKGERFRVTFAHANVDCELRAPEGQPLCAEVCQWWSATTDNATAKPKTNMSYGRLFKCPEVDTFAWRFWDDTPASCRPKGNLILRAYGATPTGEDCLGGGVGPGGCTAGSTQPCSCPGGASGVQTCQGNGTWGSCGGCTGGNNNNNNTGTGCTPGKSEACKCSDGSDGAQTCNAQGNGYNECKCESGAAPSVSQVTPNKGPVNQNIPITVIGSNFAAGAKVIIGVVAANNVNVLGPTSISATVPAAIKSGVYDVIVENPNGRQGLLRDGFEIEGGCGCTTLDGSGRIPLSGSLWLLFLVFLFVKKRRYA